MRPIFATAGVIAVAAIPAVLAAQTWRTFDAARTARDTSPISVHVTYGAGRVKVESANDKQMYGVHMRYDAESTDPLYKYDASSRALSVGINRVSRTLNIKENSGNDLSLVLGKTMPVRMQLDIGAAEGDFDLTGLQLEDFSLQTGASDTRVHFDAPNPLRMRGMRLQVGAAGIQVNGIGNANAERLELNLGVGHALLDFGGDWRGDLDLVLQSALGKVTLRVPSDVGVRVESSSFLHSLSAPGLVKRDGYYESPNFSAAKYKLRVHSSGAFGQLEVIR